MSPTIPPERSGAGPSVAERVIKAVSEALASLRTSQPPAGDLLDGLNKAESEVLGKHWPEGKPSGDGRSYFDRVMRIRLRRFLWKSRVETGGELVWLLGKLAGVALVFAIAWQTFVA